MEKNIDISVSGGNLNIGNLSQGDQASNTVNGNIRIEEAVSNDISEALSEIKTIAIEKSISNEHVEALIKEIHEIKASIKGKQNPINILKTIESLCNKYDWAVNSLKKIASIIAV